MCCTQQAPELSPREKFNIYLDKFLSSWNETNPLFNKSAKDLEIEIIEKNASAQLYFASFSFPLNWTEFQYVEESDFAQGYDVTIQVKSTVEVTHEYNDGNWSFASARQYDFNTTMIEHADDYSKIIGNAWIKRLPVEKPFTEADLFKRIPPTRKFLITSRAQLQQLRERSSLRKYLISRVAGWAQVSSRTPAPASNSLYPLGFRLR